MKGEKHANKKCIGPFVYCIGGWRSGSRLPVVFVSTDDAYGLGGGRAVHRDLIQRVNSAPRQTREQRQLRARLTGKGKLVDKVI